MNKRMKLALAAILLGLGLVFGACDAGTAVQTGLQVASTQVTPSAGGINLSSGSR